jgi:hypothetical protein
LRPYLEKYPSQKRAGRLAQDEAPEFKPQNHHHPSKKEKKKNREAKKFKTTTVCVAP